MRSILQRIIPFIFLGVAIVALVAGLILFSYLLIFGAIVGVVLFVLSWAKEKFFPSKQITTYKEKPKQGRTFDHEE